MKQLFSFLMILAYTMAILAQQPKTMPGKTGGNYNNGSAESLGRALVQGMFIDRSGYPNIQLRAGYSFGVGSNLSLKAELGKAAGISVEVGLGKKFKLDYQTRYLGLGLRGGNGISDIAFGIKFGQAVNEYFTDISEPGEDNTFFYLFLDYSHFFERHPRFGYYLGAGFGGVMAYDDVIFEFHCGITYKIYAD